MNAAHFPPFRLISDETQGHALDRPISVDQSRALQKLDADLGVAAHAIDAAITRIQSEHLPVEVKRLYIALMFTGALRINVQDVLSQIAQPDVLSERAAAMSVKAYGKKLRSVA
jgi:hypothetical protein